MIAETIEQISKACDGEIYIPQAVSTKEAQQSIFRRKITHAVTDSRQIVDSGVFFALVGERVDGHAYVQNAADNGCEVAIVQHIVEDVAIPQIKVVDTVKALGKLASHNIELRRQKDSRFLVVGITGSVGKTTTKDFTAYLLSKCGETIWPQGSFNNEIGLPLTALRVTNDTRFLVVEMGANHMGELSYLAGLVKPDIAIELKVGVAHVGEFGSPSKVFEAKSELVEALTSQDIALLNANDELVSKMATLTHAKVRYFGVEDNDPNTYQGHPLYVSVRNVHCDKNDCAEFDLIFEGKLGGHTHLQIPGKHTVNNAMAAAAVAYSVGLSPVSIIQGLEAVVQISPHRMDIRSIQTRGIDFTMIDDTFNANPDSMSAALHVLRRWKERDKNAYVVAVLGPMFELGTNSVKFHYDIGKEVYMSGIDMLVCVGIKSKEAETDDSGKNASELSESYKKGAIECAQAAQALPLDIRTGPLRVVTVNNSDEVFREIIYIATQHPHAVILLKGSHASHLSEVADRIIGDQF